ncbi:hypothetical protein [Lactobacillus sp. PV012]|uniref:hypothetical protein n=1 Tax=Lactobacillus sp. PV012 TaxID=2594494 RepID=UPI00223FE166|nr:hypothetical protein [Lactobacillus sp. PV012]QNQ81806.1 hypothetical protein FP433_01420 [Lactobacillus sp. PV012]
MTQKKIMALVAIDIMVIMISLSWRPNTYNLKIVDAILILVSIGFGIWLIIQAIKRKRKK